MKKLITIAILAAAFVSCAGGNGNGNSGEFASYKRVPLQRTLTGAQPMSGIVLWTTNAQKNTKAISLEYSYMLYNEVCKEKGVYDWSVVDDLLDDIASRGHQAVIRFRYTYVGQETSTPDYIKALPDYEETVGPSEGRTTHFPDWRCEELMRFHLEFHRLFAERYDRDPRLAFVETGFGLWAEYHIYDGPCEIGRTFPSKEFQAKTVKALSEYFHDTTWSISIDAADDFYSPFKAQPELLNYRFGNFDDSFMCEDHDGYNYESWKFFGEDRFRTAPLGGEFSYYTRDDQRHCLDVEGMYGRKFEDEVAKFHMTFIIGNDQPRYQSMERIQEASLAMGYKFEIRDFRIKNGSAAVCIANVGVAPIYRDAFVSVNGVRGDFNLSSLMPGEEQWVLIPDCSADMKSAPEIACDHLVPGQKIEYLADIK